MWQLLGVGLLALSAWGYVALHDKKQQEIGAAKITAKLAEDKAAVEADIARANQEGKLKALELLAAARKRQLAAESNLETLRLSRREESDARAKIDPVHARWSVELVPDWDAERLRLHAESFAAAANRDRLSGQHAVPLDAPIAADSAPVDESWVAGIRRKFAGLFGGGTQSK